MRHKALQQPSVPISRSPTPPLLDPGARLSDGKIRFTEADSDFYLKYLRWRVKHEPTVKRTVLSSELHAKAPHHTVGSWASFYRRHRQEVDIIFNPSLTPSSGEDTVDENSDGDWHSTHQSSRFSRSCNVVYDSGSAREEEFPDTDDDVAKIGVHRAPITPECLRVVARLIVKTEDWGNLSENNQVHLLHEKYPQRTIASWRHCLERKTTEIRQYIRIYESLLRQRAQEKYVDETGSPEIQEIPPPTGSFSKRAHASDASKVPSAKRRAPDTVGQ